MIAYIKGTISQINLDSLVIDNNGIGYEVFFSRPEKVTLNQEIMLHTYHKVAEEDQSLYGFEKISELRFFKQLLSVKGIGAKSAMNILSQVNIDTLITAIAQNNLDYLKTISGIGNKSASQIILDLQGKLTLAVDSENSLAVGFLQDSLRSLGYKNSEINAIVNELADKEGWEEAELLKQALQLLAKKRG